MIRAMCKSELTHLEWSIYLYRKYMKVQHLLYTTKTVVLILYGKNNFEFYKIYLNLDRINNIDKIILYEKYI